jgi:hypothetical protein
VAFSVRSSRRSVSSLRASPGCASSTTPVVGVPAALVAALALLVLLALFVEGLRER